MLLYHRTTKALLEKILVENTLSSSNRKVWFQNPRVSFSKLANLYRYGEMCLIFDGDLLSQDYELREVDYSKEFSQYAEEEEVYVESDIRAITKYLLDIVEDSHGELADKEYTFIGTIPVEANEPLCVVDVGED